MDECLSRLESRFGRIEASLSAIDGRLDRLDGRFDKLHGRGRELQVDVAGLKGRISNLPSTWVMLAAIVSGQITLASTIFLAARSGVGH